MADARLALVIRAAANNAALCDAVCRSHGVIGQAAADAWTSPVRTPPGYPDAVSLTPAVDRDRLLDRVDDRAGCSVKDSFAALDLGTWPGWSMLFEATWLARAAASGTGAASRTDDPAWEPVDGADALAEWATVWAGDGTDDGRWRPGVLDQDLVVLAGRHLGAITSGAVVNVTGDVVGISNIFRDREAVDPWRSCLAWVAEHVPGRTVVGYESGDDLTAALDHGFEPIGPLRVWHRDDR